MSFVEGLSILTGISSVVLAVIAIWISFHQKSQADKINDGTQKLLKEIYSDAKVISQFAMPELKAYGESMRKLVFHQLNSNKTSDDDKPILAELQSPLIPDQDQSIKKEAYLDGPKNDSLNEAGNLGTAPMGSNSDGSDEIILDLISIGKGVVKIPLNQFQDVQDFLNLIYLSFLNDSSNNVYGYNWVLINATNGQQFTKTGRFDNRSLNAAGIFSGSKYRVMINKIGSNADAPPT